MRFSQLKTENVVKPLKGPKLHAACRMPHAACRITFIFKNFNVLESVYVGSNHWNCIVHLVNKMQHLE